MSHKHPIHSAKRITNSLSAPISVFRKKVGQLRDISVDVATQRAHIYLNNKKDAFVRYISTPAHARALQEHVASVMQIGFNLGFRANPDARLLFEFVQWTESRHGRDTVMAIVLKENILTKPELINNFVDFATMLAPFSSAAQKSSLSAAQVEAFKNDATECLLRLICALAALESKTIPPYCGGHKAMSDYFVNAPAPSKFRRLARLILGQEQSSRHRADSRFNAVIKGILNRNPPANGMSRYIPGFNDDSLYFIVFSYTFFLQAYLMRHLVEHLPDVLAAIAPPANHSDVENDDTINI